MKRKLKPYALYQVKFFDHSCGGSEPGEIIINMAAYFINDSEKFYHFSHWVTECPKVREHNLEMSSILKNAIIKITEIKSPNPLQ